MEEINIVKEEDKDDAPLDSTSTTTVIKEYCKNVIKKKKSDTCFKLPTLGVTEAK